jgi:hypothetical protein
MLMVDKGPLDDGLACRVDVHVTRHTVLTESLAGGRWNSSDTRRPLDQVVNQLTAA